MIPTITAAMPPKKDAFADLFESASRGASNSSLNSKLNNLSLSERQQLQDKPGTLYSQLQSANSSWWDIDVLSPSRQPSPAGLATQSDVQHSMKNLDDDPFAIFQDQGSNTKLQSNRVPLNEASLLDDDFTDFFQDNKTSSKPVDDVSSSSQMFASPSQPQESLQRPRAKQPTPSGNANQPKSTEQRDLIVAELIDIGFDIDQCNEAIDAVGLDLQKCVNYIMNKNTGGTSDESVLGQAPGLININEIGNNLFKKANNFINFSRNAVLKNLEQLNRPKDNNLPEWMRNQAKYKSEAIEKKYGGEDYGTDDENINHADIERFMKQQKDRERERFNRSASPSVSSKRPEFSEIPEASRHASSGPELPRRPTTDRGSTPVLPRRPPRVKGETASTSKSTNDSTIIKPTQLLSPVSANTMTEPKSEASVDLLGLGSEKVESTQRTSTIRDSSQLNQFIQTDFILAKEKATSSFKSGDYTLALDAYTSCLSLLPSNHELRVVILSNLATVNKLLGHLRDSLTNVDEAQKLISSEESASDKYMISDKPMKYWSIKLLAVKAEVLELLEKYPESLQLYLMLIQRFNCNDKKFMDAKRRVDKIVNPQNYSKPKTSNSSSPAPTRSQTPSSSNSKVINEEEVDTLVQDSINERIQKWAQSKQNNLRAMLTNLNEIIPSTISMNDKSRNLSLNDLMLPKQVKIQYMRVISSIHPDKLASQPKELQLVCTGVFIILNKAWEEFKESN